MNYSAIAIPAQPPLWTFYSRIILGNFVSVLIIPEGRDFNSKTGSRSNKCGTPVAGWPPALGDNPDQSNPRRGGEGWCQAWGG